MSNLTLELKRKWVAALCSGKYKQGSGYLRQVDEQTEQLQYCCLGVLADVMGREWENGTRWSDSISNLVGEGENRDDTGTRDRELNELLGYDTVSTLAWMNDDDHKSFNDIAKYIEEVL